MLNKAVLLTLGSVIGNLVYKADVVLGENPVIGGSYGFSVIDDPSKYGSVTVTYGLDVIATFYSIFGFVIVESMVDLGATIKLVDEISGANVTMVFMKFDGTYQYQTMTPVSGFFANMYEGQALSLAIYNQG